MSEPKKLYKTTIVIWSEYPGGANDIELEDLAHEASFGDAFCSEQTTKFVVPDEEEDWTAEMGEFFGIKTEEAE